MQASGRSIRSSSWLCWLTLLLLLLPAPVSACSVRGRHYVPEELQITGPTAGPPEFKRINNPLLQPWTAAATWHERADHLLMWQPHSTYNTPLGTWHLGDGHPCTWFVLKLVDFWFDLLSQDPVLAGVWVLFILGVFGMMWELWSRPPILKVKSPKKMRSQSHFTRTRVAVAARKICGVRFPSANLLYRLRFRYKVYVFQHGCTSPLSEYARTHGRRVINLENNGRRSVDETLQCGNSNSCPLPGGMPHWHTLDGGMAGGSTVTKRKRKRKPKQNGQDSSLAEGLMSFLEQWGSTYEQKNRVPKVTSQKGPKATSSSQNGQNTAPRGGQGKGRGDGPKKTVVGSRATTAATGLRPSEWTLPPTLFSFGKFQHVVKEGVEWKGHAVVEIRSMEDWISLNTLLQAFNLSGNFTALLVGSARAVLGTTVTRITIYRGMFGPAIETVDLLQFGDKNSCAFVAPKQPVAKDKLPCADKTLIRVVAPAHYRKSFLENNTKDSSALIVSTLAQSAEVRAGQMLGGQWALQTTGKSTQLVGHLRVRATDAPRLVKNSGSHGIFVSEVPKNPADRINVAWIRKLTPEESPENYHRRCLALKATRKQPCITRGGGGHDIGFPRLPSDEATAHARVFDATGWPSYWDQDDVCTLLANLGWKDVTTLSRKKNKSEVSWRFKGVPPAPSEGKASWGYDIGDNDDSWALHVLLAPPKITPPETTRVAGPG